MYIGRVTLFIEQRVCVSILYDIIIVDDCNTLLR